MHKTLEELERLYRIHGTRPTRLPGRGSWTSWAAYHDAAHFKAVKRLQCIQYVLKEARLLGARFDRKRGAWFGFTPPIPWDIVSRVLSDERAAITRMAYHRTEHHRCHRRQT